MPLLVISLEQIPGDSLCTACPVGGTHLHNSQRVPLAGCLMEILMEIVHESQDGGMVELDLFV